MKLCSIFILSFFVSSILCENGGVKVAINQRFIDAMLDFFFKNLTDLVEKRSIPDKGILYNMEYGIEGLTREKILLNFEPSGSIHAKLSGVTPYFRGKAKLLGKKTFKGWAKDFSADIYVKVVSKQQQNGRYAPKLELASTPKLNIKIKTDISGGILGWLLDKFTKALAFIANLLMPLLKSIILPQITHITNRIPYCLPTEYFIDNSKGLKMDFALASPIKIKNRFLELNSIAFLYNDKIADTKNSNRYLLSYLPEFNNMENQFQLYVSEYFLNSAIYTLIKTYENIKPLKVKTNTNLINAFLPGIVDEYGSKDAQLTITNLENSNLKLTNNIIDINALGVLTVHADGVTAPVYRCEIELSIKAKIGISSGPALSGELENINAKVTKTLLNSNPKIKTPVIGAITETINTLFIPLLKEFTKENFKIDFPTVLGIKFEDVTLDIKDHYFVVNYNFHQGGSRRGTFGGSNIIRGHGTTNHGTPISNQNGNFGGSGNRSTNTANSNGTSGGGGSFGGSRSSNTSTTSRNGGFGSRR